MRAGYFGILLLVFFASCTQTYPDKLKLPHSKNLFFVPEENPLTEEKVALGRQLFYDKILSLDSSVSCASCHLQKFAFADTAAVSVGYHGESGNRNSPTLANLAFQRAFFYDGIIQSIERAVHPPLFTDVEMNMNPKELISRLQADSNYTKSFRKAFNKPADYKSVVYALASFQRTMVSLSSPFDTFYLGNENALSESAQRGYKLFTSAPFNCSKCHVPPFFTDNKVHNIGLYKVYQDYGFGRVSRKEEDYGKMKTPTLRNVAITSPYMHNGSIKDLKEVIRFYASGGENHPNKSSLIKPFNISEEQIKDLEAFLQSLTDKNFLTNPAYSDPNLQVNNR